jgi:hypothetical protein
MVDAGLYRRGILGMLAAAIPGQEGANACVPKFCFRSMRR